MIRKILINIKDQSVNSFEVLFDHTDRHFIIIFGRDGNAFTFLLLFLYSIIQRAIYSKLIRNVYY